MWLRCILQHLLEHCDGYTYYPEPLCTTTVVNNLHIPGLQGRVLTATSWPIHQQQSFSLKFARPAPPPNKLHVRMSPILPCAPLELRGLRHPSYTVAWQDRNTRTLMLRRLSWSGMGWDGCHETPASFSRELLQRNLPIPPRSLGVVWEVICLLARDSNCKWRLRAPMSTCIAARAPALRRNRGTRPAVPRKGLGCE